MGGIAQGNLAKQEPVRESDYDGGRDKGVRRMQRRGYVLYGSASDVCRQITEWAMHEILATVKENAPWAQVVDVNAEERLWLTCSI